MESVVASPLAVVAGTIAFVGGIATAVVALVGFARALYLNHLAATAGGQRTRAPSATGPLVAALPRFGIGIGTASLGGWWLGLFAT